MQSFKLILGAFALVCASTTHATIVNEAGGGINWNYDDVTGKDWLDLTHTRGKSFSQITANFAGWTVANESLWHTMYVNNYDGILDGSAFGYEVGQTDPSGYETSHHVDADFSSLSFLSDFGATRRDDFGTYSHIYSYGWMFDAAIDRAVPTVGDLRMGGLFAVDQHDFRFADTIFNYVDYAGSYGAYLSSPDSAATAFGWYLVRDHGAAVPEPSIIALFSLGLVGIGFVRRRRS